MTRKWRRRDVLRSGLGCVRACNACLRLRLWATRRQVKIRRPHDLFCSSDWFPRQRRATCQVTLESPTDQRSGQNGKIENLLARFSKSNFDQSAHGFRPTGHPPAGVRIVQEVAERTKARGLVAGQTLEQSVTSPTVLF